MALKGWTSGEPRGQVGGMKPTGLTDAYALNGPQDCRALYAGWADEYDAGFAAGMDYRLPAEVAAAFLRAGPPEGPVLDAGAGTGLLAAALRGYGHQGALDALDLSVQMLARAGEKSLYRALIEADLTLPLPPIGPYAGVVSSGTFTHGHVGHGVLAGLLACTAPDAVVALSVNAGIWAAQRWEGALAALPITALDLRDVAIYGEAARLTDPAHAGDRALIVTFRRV